MELFKLFGTIAVDNSGANSAIDGTADKASQAEGKMSKAFAGVGKGAVALGKVIASGVAVGSVAIAGLAKSALDSYADYEQLVGGVETLFKDASAQLMGFANVAYKTAGLSANEYMETVTSFSASLIQSLNGDTAKASEIANQAIIDMSDNANKMGTSMESIQNAYQGFAKQNYTMLDNLKLGYGGTKEEMARLLADAQAISGIEYDISSYADVVEAIHVIQNEMGITGTTAKEASATISGSLSAMKASWANLLTGFGDENADLSGLVGNLAESLRTAIQNIMPRVKVILAGIVDVIKEVVPIIVEELPSLIEELLPSLIEGAVEIFNGLVTALPTLVEMLVEQIPLIISQLGEALTEAIPALWETLKSLFGQLLEFLGLDSETTSQIVNGLFGAFESILPPIMTFMQMLIPVVQELFTLLLPPITQIVEKILPLLFQLLEPIMALIQPLASLLAPIIDCLMAIITPLLEILDLILPPLIAVLNVVISVLVDRLGNAIQVVSGLLKSVLGTAFEHIRIVLDMGKNVFNGFIDFFKNVFAGNWEGAWESIKNIFESIWNGVVAVFKNIINGIIGGVETMVNGVCGAINGIINGINSLIGKAGGVIGLEIAIPTIPDVSLPRLEKGGILEKGQIGFLEGNGAEAVVPLDQNEKWINRVAQDMNGAVGGNEVLYKILDALNALGESLPEEIADAIASLRFEINNREFARLVKGV